MAPGRLTVILLWLGAATASERRKNKKKALAAAKGRPAAMTLEARPLKYKDDAVGLYAQTWAAAHTNRSGVAHFFDSYTTDSYDVKDVTRVSNHHVKMPATLAVLAHPSVRGVYYVDLDSVAQLPFNVTPRDPARRAGPARGDLRLAKTGRREHVLLRGEPGAHR